MPILDYSQVTQGFSPFKSIMEGAQLAQQQQFGQERLLQAEQQRQQQALEAQQAQEKKDRLAAFGAMKNKSFRDYQTFLDENPDLYSDIKGAFSQRSEQQQQNDVMEMLTTHELLRSGKIDMAKENLQELATANRNSGNEQRAKGYEMALQQLDMGDEGIQAAESMTGAMLAAVAPDLYQKRYGMQGEDTVQSSEILPDGSSIALMRKGNVRVTDAEGNILKGKAAAEAVKKAKEYGITIEGLKSGIREQKKLEEQLGTKAQITAQEEAAKLAEKKRGEFFDQYQNIQKNIMTIEEGIQIIEKGIAEGKDLGVGPIRKYFGAWGQTANQLKNVANRMGLNVVSSVTFGALSESELKMAMETAMPTTLKGPALLQWMKDRKSAQEKLASYLAEAANFIGSEKEGGGVNGIADWMKIVESKKGKTVTTSADLKSISPEDRIRMLQGD